MRKILAVLGVVSVFATFAVQAAPAAENPYHPAPTVVCLNGGTTALPASVPYTGGASNLSEAVFPQIEANAANGPGGLFFAGFLAFNINRSLIYLPDFIGDTPEGLFNPGWSTNNVTRGACLAKYVVLERMYVVCYANWPNSVENISGDQLRARLLKGEIPRIPLASTSQVTNYPRGTHWLTCNAGSQTPTGKVVSTGNAGEVVSNNAIGMSYMGNPTQIGNYTFEVS